MKCLHCDGTGEAELTTIYDRAYYAIRKREITTAELEERYNIPHSTLNNLKFREGGGLISSNAVKIAKALNVSTDWLLGVTDEMDWGDK